MGEKGLTKQSISILCSYSAIYKSGFSLNVCIMLNKPFKEPLPSHIFYHCSDTAYRQKRKCSSRNHLYRGHTVNQVVFIGKLDIVSSHMLFSWPQKCNIFLVATISRVGVILRNGGFSFMKFYLYNVNIFFCVGFSGFFYWELRWHTQISTACLLYISQQELEIKFVICSYK